MVYLELNDVSGNRSTTIVFGFRPFQVSMILVPVNDLNIIGFAWLVWKNTSNEVVFKTFIIRCTQLCITYDKVHVKILEHQLFYPCTTEQVDISFIYSIILHTETTLWQKSQRFINKKAKTELPFDQFRRGYLNVFFCHWFSVHEEILL